MKLNIKKKQFSLTLENVCFSKNKNFQIPASKYKQAKKNNKTKSCPLFPELFMAPYEKCQSQGI